LFTIKEIELHAITPTGSAGSFEPLRVNWMASALWKCTDIRFHEIARENEQKAMIKRGITISQKKV
jgi:hypothetical protein